MKKLSKILLVTILSVLVVSLFACMGSDGTASTGYLSNFDEKEIETVSIIDSNGTEQQITHNYGILVEKSKMKGTVEKLSKDVTVLYEAHFESEDGTYYYDKLVVKVGKDKVKDFIEAIKNNEDISISSINVETIKIKEGEVVSVGNRGFEKIDIEINAGSSSNSNGTSDIIIYVFLGLIVAVIIGSAVYKFVKAKKMAKKQAEQQQNVENTENTGDSENKGGDFFS